MKRRQVLLVDSDEHARGTLQSVFERAGYGCLGVGDGARMWEALSQSLPDLIILELLLPGANGYALLEALQADECLRPIPVIMITGRTAPVYRRISADLGATWHFTRPCDPGEVVARASAALAAPSLTLSASSLPPGAHG